MTAVANTAFTAAQFNTYVRDNLNETSPAKATTAGSLFVATGLNAIAERIPDADTVSTSESTASTSYTDLTTPGPAVTVTTGTKAMIFIVASLANNTNGQNSTMSFAVSGATTLAANDDWSLGLRTSTGTSTVDGRMASMLMMTTLTGGSNTFTAKYKVNGGTGNFNDRHIVVLPL